MRGVTVLVLVLTWCTQTVYTQEGIGLILNNVQYTNNSVVTITDIGTGSAALVCTTTRPGCCLSTDGSQWYFPNGSAVQRSETLPYYRTRTQYPQLATVRLHRNPGATTTGVFRCDILGYRYRYWYGYLQSIYVGIYTARTGSPSVTSLRYDYQSRTLTCTSTGGPATTVTWRKDGIVITLNATYQQTKRLTDNSTSTYQTALTIDPSVSQSDILGTYNCTVENARGRSSRMAVVAPTDPPQNFTVTPEARNMTFSWSPPSTLRNGVITGYFLSCVPEVGGRNSASMQFTTAGTFTLVGFTPATSYNCSIFASNIWGNGPAAYSMVSTLDDSMLFQLQLSGLPSTCRMWINSDTSAKLSDIINAVVQNTERLCRCGFNAERITDYAFHQCSPNSDQQVTFRGKLQGTAQATSSQLIEDIQQWVNTELPVAVQGVRVTTNTCPVAIISFGDPQCLDVTTHSTSQSDLFSQTTPETSPTSMETTSDSTTTETALVDTHTIAIVGGAVAGVIILILVLTVIVIAVCVTKNRKYKYPTDQDVGKQPSEVAGSSTADITTTQCEAYKLAKLGQEHEVFPKPEYDVIPVFEGGQRMQGQEYDNITAQPPVPTLQETSGRLED